MDGANTANTREEIRQQAVQRLSAREKKATRQALYDAAFADAQDKQVRKRLREVPKPLTAQRQKEIAVPDSLREIRAMNKRDVEDRRPHCTTRPDRTNKRGGGSKGFVPWCRK